MPAPSIVQPGSPLPASHPPGDDPTHSGESLN